MRPEDRLEWHREQRQKHCEWAKEVDPEAVAAFEERVEALILKAERIPYPTAQKSE